MIKVEVSDSPVQATPVQLIHPLSGHALVEFSETLVNPAHPHTDSLSDVRFKQRTGSTNAYPCSAVSTPDTEASPLRSSANRLPGTEPKAVLYGSRLCGLATGGGGLWPPCRLRLLDGGCYGCEETENMHDEDEEDKHYEEEHKDDGDDIGNDKDKEDDGKGEEDADAEELTPPCAVYVLGFISPTLIL